MRNDMARKLSGTIVLALRRAVRRRHALAVLVPVLAAGLVIALLPGGHHSPRRAGTPKPAIRPAGALAGGLQPAVTAAALEQAKRKPVTLLTGDQVRLMPAAGGRSVVTPVSTKPSDNPFAYTFQVGSDVYSIPGAALPYVGKQLDPRLFDVSYLQRAGYANLKALPVSVSWRGSTHSAVPGITTPTSGSNTAGSVATAGAPALGKALKNHASALTQVKKISLGDLPAAQGSSETLKPAPAVPMSSSAAPGTKLYSLRVNTLDRDGKPSVGVVAIQNLKSMATYYSVSAVDTGGTIAVSVPAGQYAVDGFIYDVGPGNFPENLAFLSADVDASHDTEVTLDSRQATEITVSVPKPAAPTIQTMTFARTSADQFGVQGAMSMYGQGISSSILPPTHMYARPRPAPKVGTLGFADAWDLVPIDSGLTGVDIPYSYCLDFASQDGVPSNLSHTLTDKDLATVHDSYAASIPDAHALAMTVPFHSWSTLSLGLFPAVFDFPAPTKRDDYFGGSTDTVWQQLAVPTSQINPTSTPPPGTWGPYRTFRPGQTDSATWGASPAVPVPEWQTMGVPYGSTGGRKRTESFVCPACRQGDVMAFNVVASGDDDPTHSENWTGLGAGVLTDTLGQATDSLKFYRNGAFTQLAGLSGQMFPMLPGKASYTVDWDHTIPVAWTQLATGVHSVWKFSSSRPARADRVPSYELCAPDANQACSYVPLVFASYDFGANLSGQVTAPGTETFTLTGYHQANETGAPAVTDASVQVSYDDGSTWAAATVTKLSGGKFRVSVNQPDPSATSGYASVKVTLTDGAGNSLDQTITRAYALTATAPATHR